MADLRDTKQKSGYGMRWVSMVNVCPLTATLAPMNHVLEIANQLKN